MSQTTAFKRTTGLALTPTAASSSRLQGPLTGAIIAGGCRRQGNGSESPEGRNVPGVAVEDADASHAATEMRFAPPASTKE